MSTREQCVSKQRAVGRTEHNIIIKKQLVDNFFYYSLFLTIRAKYDLPNAQNSIRRGRLPRRRYPGRALKKKTISRKKGRKNTQYENQYSFTTCERNVIFYYTDLGMDDKFKSTHSSVQSSMCECRRKPN